MGTMKILFAAAVVVSFAAMGFLLFSGQAAEGNVLVFAYGNQLPSATLSSRSGGFVSARPAVLPGFRMEFESNRGSEFGVANLAADDGGEVAGAVYELTAAQANSLRLRSGSEGFYRTAVVDARLAGGTIVRAHAYVLSGETHAASPSRPTVEAASRGLQEFGYGENELQEVAIAALRAA